MDLGIDLTGQSFKRFLERPESNSTPGASDIRDKINTHHEDQSLSQRLLVGNGDCDGIAISPRDGILIAGNPTVCGHRKVT